MKNEQTYLEMTGQRKELFIIKEFKNKGNTNERKV
jgi:hypothetical protein